MMPAGGICIAGAVQGAADYYGDYWTAVDRRSTIFYWYTQAANLNLKQHVVWKHTVQMLSGWIVATRHSP
jgi:hypothetical protein